MTIITKGDQDRVAMLMDAHLLGQPLTARIGATDVGFARTVDVIRQTLTATHAVLRAAGMDEAALSATVRGALGELLTDALAEAERIRQDAARLASGPTLGVEAFRRQLGI
jgi:hypothetical protein